MKLATYCHQMKQCPPLLERNWKNKHFVTRKWPRLCRYFPLNDARMKNGSNENLTSHVWPFFHLISWHVSWLITWHALDRTLRLLSALVPFTCPVATSNRWHHPSDKTVLISVPLSLSLSLKRPMFVFCWLHGITWPAATNQVSISRTSVMNLDFPDEFYVMSPPLLRPTVRQLGRLLPRDPHWRRINDRIKWTTLTPAGRCSQSASSIWSRHWPKTLN